MVTINRLLITGAAGGLGTQLRQHATHLATTLRLSDIAELGESAAHEELVQCDLGDYDAVMTLTEDVDAVVHLGGIALENTFENILHANIRGTYNLYESCRRRGIKRIIYASSNHSIGYYQREDMIGSDVPHRPDSLYGVSKAFAEDLARYYYDKFGIETVVIRIGSCFEEPRDRRMLATWMSYRDFIEMVSRALHVPRTGYLVVYGVSDNDEAFWDNSAARVLGYRPHDNAEQFRAAIESRTPVPDPTDPAVRFVGGGFCAAGHYED